MKTLILGVMEFIEFVRVEEAKILVSPARVANIRRYALYFLL